MIPILPSWSDHTLRRTQGGSSGAELGPAVGVHNHHVGGLASGDRGSKRGHGEVGGHPLADGVADDPVGE
jgi:hypothetical protein